MSVTLFHCLQCGVYTDTGAAVSVNVRLAARLDCVKGVLWGFEYSLSLPDDGIALNNIVESHCPECGEPTELVVLDECPHRWGNGRIDRLGQLYHICQFCNERMEGKIVYVTEFSK